MPRRRPPDPDVAATNLKEAIAIRRAAGDEAGAYRATLWLAEAYQSGRIIDDIGRPRAGGGVRTRRR